MKARITTAYSGYYKFTCESGEGVARLKKTAYRKARREMDSLERGAVSNTAAPVQSSEEVPTTGDYVELEWNPSGESRIISTYPRRTKFERVDPSSRGSRKAQILAANFDTLFILMSMNKNFSLRRLERFAALARKSGARVVVVLSKLDLAAREDAEKMLADTRAALPDVEVHAVSSLTGEGLDAVRAYALPGETLVFFGSSGVGKSSLVNALAGEDLMPTLETREWDDEGRHTTTERELVALPNGAFVIDTPGIRELGMWEVYEEEIASAFADVESHFGKCRFSDCRHESEPGCAVKAAIESGELSQDRWEAYLRLKKEAAATAAATSSGGTKPRRERQLSGHRYRR